METETWVRPARKLKQKDKEETKSASSPGPTPATAEPSTEVQTVPSATKSAQRDP